MSSILVDASAIPVSNFTESFFFNPGVDKRFTGREFCVYYPINHYHGANTIKFQIPKASILLLFFHTWQFKKSFIDQQFVAKPRDVKMEILASIQSLK